jgi:hypothetical protein
LAVLLFLPNAKAKYFFRQGWTGQANQCRSVIASHAKQSKKPSPGEDQVLAKIKSWRRSSPAEDSGLLRRMAPRNDAFLSRKERERERERETKKHVNRLAESAAAEFP